MTFLKNILNVVRCIPSLDRTVNQQYINRIAMRTTPRPRPYSLWSSVDKPDDVNQQGPISEYTSWPSLTDTRFFARHLPPAKQSYTDSLPRDERYNDASKQWGAVTSLFQRNGPIVRDRTSLLFMFFAQWFTDSILRTDTRDRRRNTSNHQVDLCQIYGLDEDTAHILRSKKDGKLRSQMINGEEYMDYLGESDGAGGWKVKEAYADLPYVKDQAVFERLMNDIPASVRAARREKFYATGLERGNSSIGYVAISTVFMREHNRICDDLKRDNPTWDDERLFQTARVINIVLLLKLVVEDYVNQIADYDVFHLDTTFAEKNNWYRPNWIAIEFDLLYRWHSLVPEEIEIEGTSCAAKEFRYNNALLEELGVGAIITSASSQAAGRIGLSNTPHFLLSAEYESIKMSRDFRLCSYNDYREDFNLDRLDDFASLTRDVEMQRRLKDLYGDIDRVEFFVGLFAEDHHTGALFGSLMTKMVSYDAFTQIFTNPLLSRNIYTADTFTAYGLQLIDSTTSIQALVSRTVGSGGRASLGV